MARNEKFMTPAFEVGRESGSGRRSGLLKKLAIAGVALGAVLNTANCSADSEPSCPMAIETVTEGAASSVASEVADIKVGKQSDGEGDLTSEEMQCAEEIVIPEVLERLGELEQLAASAKLPWHNIYSDKDWLSFYEEETPTALGYGREQGITFYTRGVHSFYTETTRKGTILKVWHDVSAHAYQRGELIKYDKMSPGLKAAANTLGEEVKITFSTPNNHLLDGNLTVNDVRRILEDPELQITYIENDIGGQVSSAWVDSLGILGSEKHRHNGDGAAIFDGVDRYPQKTLKDIVGDYRQGVGR